MSAETGLRRSAIALPKDMQRRVLQRVHTWLEEEMVTRHATTSTGRRLLEVLYY